MFFLDHEKGSEVVDLAVLLPLCERSHSTGGNKNGFHDSGSRIHHSLFVQVWHLSALYLSVGMADVVAG